MADSEAFTWLCEEVESSTDLERLEARGTVRLALKAAGLEPRTATPAQLVVVVEKILPGELLARAVDSPDAVCEHLCSGLKQLSVGSDAGQSPEDVFGRLGGN